MIKETAGNLFEAKAEALTNAVNLANRAVSRDFRINPLQFAEKPSTILLTRLHNKVIFFPIRKTGKIPLICSFVYVKTLSVMPVFYENHFTFIAVLIRQYNFRPIRHHKNRCFCRLHGTNFELRNLIVFGRENGGRGN
jgi:hypothetical protein